MPVFTFDCTDCHYSKKGYNAWRKHLLKETHQIYSRERSKNWTSKDKKRAVVVFGLRSVKRNETLKYFGDWAMMSDYVFWNERPDFSILQFLTSKFRENVISSTHSINGQKLFLRPRESITDEEWFSICPFLISSLKMEIDSGDSSSPDQFNDTSDEEDQIDIDKEENIHNTPVIIAVAKASQSPNVGSRIESIDSNFISFRKQASLNVPEHLVNNCRASQNPVDARGSESLQAEKEVNESYDGGIRNSTKILPSPPVAVVEVQSPNFEKGVGRKNKILKMQKLQPFSIQLEITQGFRNKAATVREPKLSKAIDENLSAVWLKFLIDFNNTVWPLCFGVKLVPLINPDPEEHLNYSSTNKMTSLGHPFKGILVQPEKLDWVNIEGDGSFHTKLQTFNRILKFAPTSTIPFLSDNLVEESQTPFKFEFKMLVNRNRNEDEKIKLRSTRRMQVHIKCTKVCGNKFKNKRKIKILIKMYTELWKMYSLDRMLTSSPN